MSLPFLKPKKMASTIIARRKDSTSAPTEVESEVAPKLTEHVDSLISAIHEKDSTRASAALQGIHEHFNGPKESEASTPEGE